MKAFDERLMTTLRLGAFLTAKEAKSVAEEIARLRRCNAELERQLVGRSGVVDQSEAVAG